MTTDQLLPLLLGPAGLTVGLLFALWKFSRGEWVARERLDEMRAQRDAALALVDKAAEWTQAMAKADENRREEPPPVSQPAFRGQVQQTQDRIRRKS